jgi:broad specificity phosphatase PhoE
MNGESTVDVRDRAVKAFEKILSQNTAHITQNTDKRKKQNSLGSGVWDLSSQNIAIVSHGGINRVILCHLLGIPLENIFRVEQDYGCLNIVEMWDYPVVKNINFIV